MPDPQDPSAPRSAQARLESAYEAMQADNPRINAVLDVFNDTAIESMLDADQRGETGDALSPIDGMPVGVSAAFGVEGRFHHAGIKAYAARRAERDATAVARLRKGGALITGTLNQDEGGLGATTDNPWFGRTTHPARDGHIPGGPCGGSAAAVAAQFCEAALGTDSLGGARVAAGWCGTVGFTASHDPALLGGTTAPSPTLDALTVFAQTLDTAADVMAVLLERELSRGTAGEVHLADWAGAADCEPGVQAAFGAFADTLGPLPATGLGPYDGHRSVETARLALEADAHACHADRLSKAPGGFSDDFRARLERGRDVPRAEVESARAHIAEMRDAALPDFILLPTAPITAPPFDAEISSTPNIFAALAALTGRPAIQFHIGDADGLPVGAQLVGPRGGEADLVATLRRLLG